MKTYTVPAKTLPVSYSADVVVCGGGTAGVHAAVAAADSGCSVVLIEQFGSLGGTASNGLVTPLMHSHIDGDPACSYTALRLRKILETIGGVDASGRCFDPMMLRIACEKMCVDAGVKIVYHSFISGVVTEGKTVRGIVTASKSGESVIEGKYFIDCTGDGDVSVLAGAEYIKGNPETGKCQPISLRYLVSGIDTAAFGEFILSEIARTGLNKGASYNKQDGTVYAACTSTDDWTLSPVFLEAVANGDLTVEDKTYWQVFHLPNRRDTLAFNNPEFFEYVDGTDTAHLTMAQIEGKKAILRQLAFYKKYLKGFEKACISEIAPMVGIRETRNIVTEYVLSGEELLGKTKFADAFCQSNYPVDIHGKQLTLKHNVVPSDDGKPWYEIPFRSLIVRGIDNLFVAGRCLGSDFLAQSSLRIQPCARSSGEAAGIGAALAAASGRPAREIEGASVRKIMTEKGAEFK